MNAEFGLFHGRHFVFASRHITRLVFGNDLDSCTWILKNVVININGVSCSQEGKTCNTTYCFISKLTHGPRGYCIKSVDPLNIFCYV